MELEAVANAAVRWLSYYHRAEQLVRHNKTRSPLGRQRSDFYRMVWEEAAATAGASVRHLGGMLEIQNGESIIRVSNNITSLDDPVTVAVASDKALVYRLLGEHGLPVPRHCICRRDDLATAWRFVAAQASPCVVKPARGTGGGMGVTTGVTTKARLFRAMTHAGSHAREIVIDKQVEGDNYRLLYLDGSLLDAVQRIPPTIRGDGTSTIRELISAENTDRLRHGIDASQSILRIDRELRHTLRQSGYSLRSVPPRDHRVQLKTVVNDNRRQDNVPATDRICSSLVGVGATAASLVGARLAGIDVITTDPTIALADSGGVIIEVNATPGLYFHYPTKDNAAPVAQEILDRLSRPVIRGRHASDRRTDP